MTSDTGFGDERGTHRNGADEQHTHVQEMIGPRYRLQWIIGHGGMSTVWLADDLEADREVAIKSLKPEFSNSDEFLERFRNEAEASEAIDSDNVVRTYDYFEVSDHTGVVSCFLVMEYVRGESLADLLAREGTLDENMAHEVLEQAAHGLAHIHRLGMVHRDIKPGNLLITQAGEVKITDFGIAKAAAAVPLTRTGMVVGTAQYVSPEQAQGQDVRQPSDIYSLGIVGYEMLSGRRPFTGENSVSVVMAHINQAPPPLSTAVSAQTRELIEIMLRKDPNQRYADGDELAHAIAQVRLGHRPPQPRSGGIPYPIADPSPTQATVALGAVTSPTTTHPAATPGRPTQYPASRRQRKSPWRTVTGILIALAVVIGAVVVLAQAGFFAPDRPERRAPVGPISVEPESTLRTTEVIETTHIVTEEPTEEEDSTEDEPTYEIVTEEVIPHDVAPERTERVPAATAEPAAPATPASPQNGTGHSGGGNEPPAVDDSPSGADSAPAPGAAAPTTQGGGAERTQNGGE